jgi:threonine dehydrogenase-like Zn-dependent dehydrogenase
MNTHCPARITLGIDRLPGGFAPWVLAPIEAIVEVPQAVSPLVAALTEPFAAALQGVDATRPREGERVAVLGPRRLGSLVIAALHGYRIDSGVSFQISALVRHRQLLDLAGALGADEQVLLGEQPIESLYKQYDIVFDTTGAPAGFELALRLARRVVHLKSTNGRTIMGLQRLTDMVVDEIALLPFEEAALDFAGRLTRRRGRINKSMRRRISIHRRGLSSTAGRRSEGPRSFPIPPPSL